MKRSHWQITLSLLIVFVSGAAVGALGSWLYTAKTVVASAPKPTPEQFRQRYVDDMRTRLGLDANQIAGLNRILDETRAKFEAVKEREKPEFDAIKAKHKPEFDAIHEEQVRSIRSLLNASQVAEYEKFREERRKARRSQAEKPQR